MRTFNSGATRDDDENKLDYEGFISPFVLERYATYMQKHRKQTDGKLRDSDNWQKGIPVSQYMKSLVRHVVDAWKLWRYGHSKQEVFEDLMCAIMFNTMGILYELMRPIMLESDLTPPLKVDAPPPHAEPWPTQGDFERAAIDPRGGDRREGWQPKRTKLG